MKYPAIFLTGTASDAERSEVTLDDFLSGQDDYVYHEDDGSFAISGLSGDVTSLELQAYLLLLIGMIIGILLIGDGRFRS